MTDLTTGRVSRHIVSMSGFIAAGLLFQSAYFIVDLYFVSRLGSDAVAGVAAAGTFFYLALAASQLIGVGCLSLVSQAVGRRDHPYANLVFNQSLVLSLGAAVAMLVVGYLFAGTISAWLAADAGSSASGRAYLYGFLPSLAVMFPSTALGASLRATGVVRPTMLLQSGAVLLNVILAPVLIAGWGTGRPLGVFGAGLASAIAAVLSLAVLAAILPRIQTQLRAHPAQWAPRLPVWLSLAKVGVPAAGEFFLMFLLTIVIYWSIRRFGPAAQAGYGIGARIMQSLFLPVMAISFAAAPIAGQNFGAGLHARVRHTFITSLLYVTALMAGLTLLCQIWPGPLARVFSTDPAVLAVAVQFLRMISWNFVAVGVVFACSGMFQALGDTRPSFVSSASRVFTMWLPYVVMARLSDVTLADFWRVSVGSAAVQATISLLLLRREFARKLGVEPGFVGVAVPVGK